MCWLGRITMMTVPNFYKLETSRAKLNAYDVLIDHPLDVRDGCLHLSNRPGLGIEMNVDYLRSKSNRAIFRLKCGHLRCLITHASATLASGAPTRSRCSANSLCGLSLRRILNFPP